ncbi:MAG: lipoate--protein ligase family protein [Pirellulales bacterium]|nr:lipoate--protein ligase family protein [Pirellulales bacterium]
MNKSPCRLQIDPPADGAWNMAVDEVLLAAAIASQEPTLRFYQWQRPTLSLGYFQQYQQRSHHKASFHADVVRRLSGGGAILHDHELTYSLALPASHLLTRDTQTLYDAVHKTLVRELQASLNDNTDWLVKLCEENSNQKPFLCFKRRFWGDILLRNVEESAAHKVVGSAQRRRCGAVLQHGSILLSKSKMAPGLPGVRDITGCEILTEKLLSTLPARLAESLNLELYRNELAGHFLQEVDRIQQEKYQAESWTQRR